MQIQARVRASESEQASKHKSERESKHNRSGNHTIVWRLNTAPRCRPIRAAAAAAAAHRTFLVAAVHASVAVLLLPPALRRLGCAVLAFRARRVGFRGMLRGL